MEIKNPPSSLVLKGKKELAEDEAINPSPADTLTSSPPFGNPFIRKSKLGDFFKSYTTSEAINLGPAEILMQIFKISQIFLRQKSDTLSTQQNGEMYFFFLSFFCQQTLNGHVYFTVDAFEP